MGGRQTPRHPGGLLGISISKEKSEGPDDADTIVIEFNREGAKRLESGELKIFIEYNNSKQEAVIRKWDVL
jgi:hypothetical protein